ncbi:hypothetical protein [Flavobacterium sp.]|uniref:hypothetical protein n=1 Tax=Flavobacterium sp. TaxID=239 RepID=UPI0026154EE5|nr:hypothetical protein [Flavobacterium sp.]MDD3003506.1 hypothetical protein [Flavobacterium sp.]
MFKKFNHRFVYKYPLIWNTKIVPIALIAVVFHLLFFVVGYQNAIVHSVQVHSYYNQESNAITINLFAVLLSVLVFIIWCVLYFRNNAFKAFYPKNNSAIFKEWFLVLGVCIVTFSYALSSIIGSNVQTRNAVSYKEALKNCETISKASLFLHGSYKEGQYTHEKKEGKVVSVKRDSFAFEGRNYSLKSLMNKNISSFPLFDSKQDSLRRLQMQRWMKEDKKDSVAMVLENYMALMEQHKLKVNISAPQWLDLVYDYPEFTNYFVIGKQEREFQYAFENQENESIDVTKEGSISVKDTVSTTIKNINGENYVYSKYYVSDKALTDYYTAIAVSWDNYLLGSDYIMMILYLSVLFSLMVLSFRVTSARNWLIGLIALGVIQIVFGIGTAFFGSGITYYILFLIYFGVISVYFAIVYSGKRGKKWSGIALNHILWLSPVVGLIVYNLIMDLVKEYSGYYQKYDLQTGKKVEEFPKIDWFEENQLLIFQVNLLLVVFFIFLFSRIIKGWRGIPED